MTRYEVKVDARESYFAPPAVVAQDLLRRAGYHAITALGNDTYLNLAGTINERIERIFRLNGLTTRELE